MKRIIMLIAVALIATTAFTQPQKVDVEGYQKKIAKSDASIQDTKKNTKASTWLDRGKLFLEVVEAPTKSIFSGVDEIAVKLMYGSNVPEVVENVGGIDYRSLKFPYFIAYTAPNNHGSNVISFWKTTLQITENPLEKAREAFEKAYALDNSTAAKVKSGLTGVAIQYRQNADNLFAFKDYKLVADNFKTAYEIQAAAPVNVIDSLSLFNAGYMYTAAKMPEEGLKYLTKALEYNFERNGETYYYIYHCYYAMNNIPQAKEILQKGLAKYPKNNEIIEGLLNVYTAGGGDPKEIIPIVENAIKEDPKNAELYGGLGRIYEKLNDLDQSILAFRKAAELDPNNFNNNFNLGLMIVKKAEKMNTEFNTKTPPPGSSEYNEALKKVNEAYAMGVAPLETALSLNPKEINTIELLKNLSFRLREDPAMMEKYNRYNDLFNSLKK